MNIDNTVEFYQNEKRVIQYEVDTNQLGPFNLDGADVKVLNSSKEVILEQSALVEENKMSFIVGESITETPGTYIICWKIMKSGQIFYKVTSLLIKELPCWT